MHLGKLAAVAMFAGGCLTTLARPISVAELNYNPLDSSDYEFVELINSGAAPFVLTGCKFTAGIDFTFGARTLAPGERVVIVRDLPSFTSRYPGVANAGVYKKKLSDTGDTLVFVSAAGLELFKFKYDATGDWPSRANGLGSSLEVIDPNGNLDDPQNWRSSTEYNGSHGKAGVGGVRTVVLNEVLTHTDPPLEDALELKNLTDQPIDVGGAYISNTRLHPLKYHLPKPWVVPAHGYSVLYEYQFNQPALGTNAFTFNSAHGDEAVLISADAAGKPLLWLDVVSFDSSANGVSFGRYPDGTGPLITLARQTFGTEITRQFPPELLSQFVLGKGASNALPLVGPVVFNRIQYQPPTGQDEFIEIKNISALTVPLYDPASPTNRWKLGDGLGFTFPAGQQLAPGETALIVGTTPSAFRAKHGIAATTQIFGPYSNGLSNSGERVELFRPDEPQGPQHPDAGYVPYILVEQVTYKPTAPWPTDAAGTGAYLRRIDPTLYGDDPANWRAEGIAQGPVSLKAEALSTGLIRITVIGARVSPLRLEATSTLETANWGTVATLPLGTVDSSLEISQTGAARFFRVR